MAIATAIAITGAAITGYGAYKSSKASKAAARAQQAITQKELEAERVRMQAMELDAKRRNLENIRNMQRARSMALASATNQGASQGSGLQGGYGQIFGQGTDIAVGINQNLLMGRQMFDINAQIAQQKMALAKYQASTSTGSALMSLGTSMMSASGGPLSRLGQGFGSSPATMGSPGVMTNATMKTGYGLY